MTGGRVIVWIVHRELRSLCESGLGVRNGGEDLGMPLWVGRGLWVSLWQGLEDSQRRSAGVEWCCPWAFDVWGCSTPYYRVVSFKFILSVKG